LILAMIVGLLELSASIWFWVWTFTRSGHVTK
jgi:hypothetical protein